MCSCAKDFVGHAAEHPPAEACSAVRRHHDPIHAVLLRKREDRLRRLAHFDSDIDVHAVPFRPGGNRAQIMQRLLLLKFLLLIETDLLEADGDDFLNRRDDLEEYHFRVGQLCQREGLDQRQFRERRAVERNEDALAGRRDRFCVQLAGLFMSNEKSVFGERRQFRKHEVQIVR